jgi:hypothetical protein
MAEPKDEGRSEPKDEGRSEPKDEGKGSDLSNLRSGGYESPFANGGGWVVVAFISPTGMNVPDLAARMLRNDGPQPGNRTPNRGIGRVAIEAQEKVRQQAEERNRLEETLRGYERELRVLRTAKQPPPSSRKTAVKGAKSRQRS